MEKCYYQMSDFTNKSFIEMHELLIKKGIKNNKFFMKLINPELMNLNPHSINLTKQQKIAIVEECKNNYWYFLREVIRVPYYGDSSGVCFPLNIANLSIQYLLDNDVEDIISHTTRQIGEVLGFMCYILYNYLFKCGNKVDLLNKDLDTNRATLHKFREIFTLLPDYISKYSSLYLDNIDNFGGLVRTLPNPKTKEAAISIGNTMNGNVHFYHNAAFIDHLETIVKLSTPKYVTNKQLSKGLSCYNRIFIMNIPKEHTDSYIYLLDMKQLSVRFDINMFDNTYSEIKEYINNNSNNGFITIFFPYDRMERSGEWKKEQELMLCNDKETIYRELKLTDPSTPR